MGNFSAGPWAMVGLAGLFEIAGALGLKYAWGRGPLWKLAVIAAMAASLFLLIRGLRDLPAGSAYAVWTGIGAAGVAVIGIIWFGESAHPFRLFFIALVVAGVAGLRLTARL